MKSCFFIGHREADERVYPRLRQSVERLITEEKVGAFYVGSHGGFDCLAAHAVIDAKRQHPNIVLMLVLPYHPAPCLLNLHTGEVGELEVYEPHPYKVGELAPVQRGGYFSFVSAAGASGIRIADQWVVDMDVPADEKPMKKALYCRDCRKLLETVAWDGYTLLDLYDRDAPVVLPLRDGVKYELRCYHVTVHLDAGGSAYQLKVEGTWKP